MQTENAREENTIVQIRVSQLRTFKKHPFKVRDDEKMRELVDSIRERGIVTPVVVRPTEDGGYELISGHRRTHAAGILGMETVPAIVREMTDDEAVEAMVDANLQREEILPSEKAFAYKMKLEVASHQGRQSGDASRQVVGRMESADRIGEENGDSGRQVQRYIRLTELIPDLLDLVDQKKLKLNPAVELSYLESTHSNAAKRQRFGAAVKGKRLDFVGMKAAETVPAEQTLEDLVLYIPLEFEEEMERRRYKKELHGIFDLIAEGYTPTDAQELTSKQTGIPFKEIYNELFRNVNSTDVKIGATVREHDLWMLEEKDGNRQDLFTETVFYRIGCSSPEAQLVRMIYGEIARKL